MANPFFYKKQMDTTYIDSATSFDTWVDQSSNGLDGTAGATNEPAFNFGDAGSEYNPFLIFDGTDDKITVSDDADLDFGFGDWTLEALIYMPDITTKDVYFMRRWTNSNDQLEFYFDESAGDLVARIRAPVGGGTTIAHAVASWAPSANTWYHIVWVVVNGTSNALYVDGVSLTIDGTDSTTGGNSDLTGDWEFAFNGNGSTYNKLQIQYARYWNRALSASEVLVQYNNGDYIAVPTADQWGSQTALNVSNLVNDGGAFAYDTLERVGGGGAPNTATEFHAITDGTGSRRRAGTADEIAHIAGMKYGVFFNLSLTSGFAPFYDLRSELNGNISVTDDGPQGSSAGNNYFEFTASSTGTAVMQFYNTGSSEYTMTLLNVVQVGAVAEWRLAHENAFSPFEFPKGRQPPVNSPIVPRQIVGVAGGGQTVVDDLGDADERWPINVLRVSSTAKDNLLGFLQDTTVNYRANTFQFVEEDNTDNEVRLWEPFPLDFPRVPGSLFNLVLTVRKEIS